MGKHKKHHKKHSHGYAAPAFPYPIPVFQTPMPPPLLEEEAVVPPSLCVSIGLHTLQAMHESESPRKHHRKSHHHHHHRGASSVAPVLGASAIMADRPTVPPLRISLHDTSTVLTSTAAEIEPKITELKVSIPFSSLQSTQRSGAVKDGPGEREQEHHHKKKHKRRKERRRTEQDAVQSSSGSGGKGTRAEVGGKRVSFGLEGERKSYGGKGVMGATSETHKISVHVEEEAVFGGRGRGGSEVSTQQFYKQERHHQSHREHPLSLSHTAQPHSSHPNIVQPHPSQLPSSQSHPHTSQPHSSHAHSHPHASRPHTSYPHTTQSHTSHAHSSQPHSSLENKYSDKYYQHKKRMMETKHTPHTFTPSQFHTSSSEITSHPHSVPTDTTSPLTPKHHKKKKKHRHKHSKTSVRCEDVTVKGEHVKRDHERIHLETHSELSDASLGLTVRGIQLDDSIPVMPTSEVSASFEKELIELQPLSPLSDVGKMAVLSSPGTEKEEGGGRERLEMVQKSSIRFSKDGAPDLDSLPPSGQIAPISRRHTAKPLTMSPLTSSSTMFSSPSDPPPPQLGRSGRTVDAIVPARRRRSSSLRYGSGKHLRLQAEEEEAMEVGSSAGEKNSGDGGEGEYMLVDYDPPPMALEQSSRSPLTSTHPQVVLSKTSLRMFLANLLHLVQKRDPEGIFAEPVTDDIAPGYSALIKHPMDLSTMGTKVASHAYCSAEEFKSDFVLMCKNAMTYNSPETLYYSVASNVMKDGLKLIEKELSLRPDIRYGRVTPAATSSSSQPPPSLASRAASPALSSQLDYNSPFLCRINLSLLQTPSTQSQMVGMETSPASSLDVIGEVGVAVAMEEQSHLTQVVVGVPPGEREGEEGVGERGGGKAGVRVSLVTEEEPAEVLRQVQRAAEEVKENLNTNKPNTKFCFIQEQPSTLQQQQQQQQQQLQQQQLQGGGVETEGRRKATMNILNPDSGIIDSTKPLDLTALSERTRAGNNAGTVLRTELPMFKATPVSYLMNGPFGSFAPTYDSAFATLTKMDSDLLLYTYGSDLGVSYSHSLLQFVKGAGSFASEMADAVLNSLTGGRHETFMEKYHTWEEKEKKSRMKPGGGEEAGKEGEETGEEGGKAGEEREAEKVEEGEGMRENGEEGGEKDAISEKGGGGKLKILTSDTDTGSTQDRGGEIERVEGEREEGSVMKVESMRDSVETCGEEELAQGEQESEGNGWGEKEGEGEEEEGGGEGEGEGEESALDSREGEYDIDLDWDVSELSGEGESDGEREGVRGVRSHQSLTPSQGSWEVSVSNSCHSSAEREGGRTEDSSSSAEEDKRELSVSLSPSQATGDISPDTVSDCLADGAQLLSDLQAYQWQRLAEPPSLDPDGNSILPPPSNQERETASLLTSQLASLTAQVCPQDVVQVASLHSAMGIPLQLDNSANPPPSPTPEDTLTPPTLTHPPEYTLTPTHPHPNSHPPPRHTI